MKTETAIVRECVCKFFEQFCTEIAEAGDSNSQTFFNSINKIFISFTLQSTYSANRIDVAIILEYYQPFRLLKGKDPVVISFPNGEEIDYKEVRKKVFESLFKSKQLNIY